MVICEMWKCERVFCETTCETLCDWSIGRRVFRRLPVAVVVAATGAVGSAPHACSYSFITRRMQHSTTKKDNNRTVYVQGRETVCVNMLSLVMLFVDSLWMTRSCHGTAKVLRIGLLMVFYYLLKLFNFPTFYKAAIVLLNLCLPSYHRTSKTQKSWKQQ